MLNRKNKLRLIVVTILVVMFTMTVKAGADYWESTGKIILDTTYDMEEAMGDIDRLSQGSISTSTFLDRIEEHKRIALDKLEKMTRLIGKAPFKTFHAEMVGLIGNWYLTVQLIEDGIKTENLDKINSATTVMYFVGEQAKEMENRIRQNK